VHTGARVSGVSLPPQKSAQQVSILFSETANTRYGEVSAAFARLFRYPHGVILKSRDRTSLLWAVRRSSVTGTRLTRYVGARTYSAGDGSVTKLTTRRSHWIRPITPFGARRCTYPRTRRSSISSFARNLMATYVFFFLPSHLRLGVRLMMCMGRSCGNRIRRERIQPRRQGCNGLRRVGAE